jgi:serine/threonine-protein kinase
MKKSPALVLGLLYLCFFGCLAFSGSQLPSRVATHFDGNGRPDGWMSRTAHLRFMTMFGLGFPLFVPALMYATRFLPDRFYNLPHRDYWLAPARRTEALAYLFRHSLWFASMALCFVIGIHFSIIHANNLPQVQLSTLLVLALAGCFLAGTAVWGVSLFRHFNQVP